MLTITPAAKPQARETFKIELDGVEIGELKPRDNDRWHACITVPTLMPFPHSALLIQGFGKTHEGAVSDAVTNAIAYHQKAVAAVLEFQQRLAADAKHSVQRATSACAGDSL